MPARPAHLFLAVALECFLAWDLGAAQTAAPARQRRLMYNSDGANIFDGKGSKYDLRREPMTVAELQSFVDEVAGMQVATFLLCPVGYQIVWYESELEQRFGAGFSDEQIEKWPVLWRNKAFNLNHFHRQGIDPFHVLVDRIHEKKMEALVAYRIQSAHSGSGEEGTTSPWWVAHPECRLSPKKSHLNFALPEVRQRKLALIREPIAKYGFDGVEIDFTRFPPFFKTGEVEANIPTMNGFLRDIRAMLDELGRSSAKRLVLGVKVPTSLKQCRDLGLDPAAWVHEGSVDFLNVSNHVRQGDDGDLRIEQIKASLSRSVPVYGSLQVMRTPDDYRRTAKSLWDGGVDGIALFNFFVPRASKTGPGMEPPFFLFRELHDPCLIGNIKHPEEGEYRRKYGLGERKMTN